MAEEGGGLRPVTPIDKAFWHLAAALMLAMTGVMLYAVTARYWFNRPPIWGEDVPRIIFVWMTFLTIGLAIKLGLNIRVTSVLALMPRRVRLVVEIVMHVLVLAMLAVLFVECWPLVELAMRMPLISLGISNAWIKAPLMVGCAIAAVYQARLLLAAVVALRRPDDGDDRADLGGARGAGLG
jgi:TRAP-type C4-dicarboxylate transport system permease small subunit